ncbi:MAG: Rrf2 family transcriptional regulator [Bryobacteraceae bacterium]|nr:Rrf2 family transcriptional regulator [Bryobacteraceae bacterium]
MLKLTRKADYGLIALKHMALKHGCASAREIADSYGIPLPLLSKVLQTLAKNGFVQAEHGASGGYRLRREPQKITTLEVIRSIDGPIFLTSCFTEDHICGLAGKCNVREPLRKVHEEIQRLLQSITIADMCAGESDEEHACSGSGDTIAKPDALVSVNLAVAPPA